MTQGYRSQDLNSSVATFGQGCTLAAPGHTTLGTDPRDTKSDHCQESGGNGDPTEGGWEMPLASALRSSETSVRGRKGDEPSKCLWLG